MTVQIHESTLAFYSSASAVKINSAIIMRITSINQNKIVPPSSKSKGFIERNLPISSKKSIPPSKLNIPHNNIPPKPITSANTYITMSKAIDVAKGINNIHKVVS